VAAEPANRLSDATVTALMSNVTQVDGASVVGVVDHRTI
jgi:hypothetical protein